MIKILKTLGDEFLCNHFANLFMILTTNLFVKNKLHIIITENLY